MTAPRETGAEGRILDLLKRASAFACTELGIEGYCGRCAPCVAHDAWEAYDALLATPRPVEVTEADLSFIDGNLLIDVDACAMGTATESHYDVAARDLRGRVARLLTAALRAQPAGGTRSWCEEVNEGRSRCSVQCRACELLENDAAPPLPPVGERETDGSWSDERLRSASDEDVLTLMLELRGRFALYHNEAQLEDSERCRREILRRLASHPSPAPSGERFTEEEMHYVRAVAHHWRNWAMNLNDLKRVFIGLHRKMSEMNAAAAPHPDGQGVGDA